MFNKICNKVKSQNKENLLTGIPEEIIENKEVVTDTIDIIDKVFANIMESAKNKNVKLEFDKEAIEYIAEKASEDCIGARGLRGLVEKVMKQYMFDLPDSDVKQLTITINEVKDKI